MINIFKQDNDKKLLIHIQIFKTEIMMNGIFFQLIQLIVKILMMLLVLKY